MGITIEKATPADAAGIVAYLKRIGGETDNLTFGQEGLPVTVEEEAEYLARLEGSRDDVMLLAKENGKIVGDASLHRLPRRMSHRGDLSIAVVKDHWNQGIGGRLLGEILAFARENAFAVIDLQVRRDNRQAIHLYETYGFQKIGTHPAFFKVGGQWVAFDFMCLSLGGQGVVGV